MITNNGLKGLSWDDFRIVKAIGETGSLAAAAALLGVNTSTMSRRLTHVEEVLGVALFERRRIRYLATALGIEVVALAERLELDIVSVAHRVSGQAQEYAGKLRVATADSLASQLLTPIIAEFQKLYPTIVVEVMVGNSSLNLARGETDVALRATDAPPESLFGKRIAAIAWAPYGCKEAYGHEYLTAESLYQRAWVSYGNALSTLRASGLIERSVPQDNIVYRIDSVAGVATAIAANIGVGYLPCMLGDMIPELVRLGGIEASLTCDLWLLTHPDTRKSARVNAFMTFCATMLIKQRTLIEGRRDEDRLNRNTQRPFLETPFNPMSKSA